MKISTKGRYGLRAMLDLAVHSAGDHVALGNIAERQGISESYLEQLFSTLRKAGLVKSIKGAQGGYNLAHQPSEITIGMILRALEGSLSVIGDENPKDQRSNYETCISQNIWFKINDSINHIVDRTTLEDLMNEFKLLESQSSLMYYI